jgi:flagellar hook-basal body complex protein FliE
MSNLVDTNTLLSQLRVAALRAGLSGTTTAETASTTSGATEFAEALKQGIRQVNDRQAHAASMAVDFERGVEGVELSQVMVEMQKARISFEALSQVRNKMITAYKDIMSMPI